MSRARSIQWLFYAGIAVAGLLLSAAIAAVWVVNTQAGTRWLLTTIGGLTDERFAVARVQGTVRGPLTLDGLRFETATLRLSVEHVQLDAALGALLHGTVQLANAELRGVDLALQGQADREAESTGAFDLKPPVDFVVDRFTLSDGRLQRDGESLLVLQRAELAGRWTEAGIELRQFDAYAPQGQVYLSGRAAKAGAYSGEATGRFRWTAGMRTYAGELRVDTRAERVQLNVALSQPFAASLQASLEQRDDLPWQLALRVPRFDPRERWSASTSLQSLSVALTGSGTRSRAALSGNVVINEQPLTLRTLQFELRDRVIELENLDILVADSPGVLHASGELNIGDTPRAALDVNWTELRIPESWAGQALRTRGRMRVDGGTDDYRAQGRFALGPPGRLADIVVDVNGSSREVRIDRLSIEQPAGYLRAGGRVRLDPGVQWRLMAEASRFNPGELLSGWQGQLDFALTTDGNYVQDDLRAALDLQRLAGTLRGRTLSGGGALGLNARRVLAGDLRLRADASTVQFHGEQGDDWDAALTVDIASLNDWLPQGAGSVQGRFTVTGDWPRINVAGNARGRQLRLANAAAEELAVSADVRVPEMPAGVVRAQASGMTMAGFNFAQLQARIAGDEQAHEFELTAMGKPLSLEMSANGRRSDAGWSGSLQELALQVADVQRLSLQQPAQVEYSKQRFNVSQSCLAGGDVRLCAGGGGGGGALHLSYDLQNVPLSLARAAAPTLPVTFDGQIAGRGEIRRDARGRWMGTASVVSPSGSIAQTGAVETMPLLSYANFSLEARLDGAQGTAAVNAQIDRDGQLSGRVALNGLGTADAGLQGRVEAALPSLAAVSLFAPQFANVGGRAQLQAMFAGTLAAPRISGTLLMSELGAQLPLLGLQLKGGEVRATAQSNGDVRLSGGIMSGDGRLHFDGTWAAARGAQLTLGGDQVLLADIPSARLIAAPDLKVAWAEQRLTVEGEVRVPKASVNVQKLPRGAKPLRISDDVVVVGQDIAAAETRSLPIAATVTVLLGDDVQVSGYGLESKIRGPLTIREQPGETTRASGDLTVTGTYKAYGQDLTIQKGRVLYADAPLDNPQLDITAVRMIEEVTAGLRIAGPAQQPQISVFSDPVMGEANALSYLVAGRPLDDIGTDEEDGSALQSAARSLGTAGGGLLAKQLGKRLGADEVSVKDDELIGGAAFTVGEYLSPRLFLSYGVGLFESGEVVTLRYRLSSSLSLQAQRGSEETRAGLQYRTER